MDFTPVKTRAFLPPKDDLDVLLDESLIGGNALRDCDVLFITSKIVAIGEGRCVARGSIKDKHELVEREADAFVPWQQSKWGFCISIKNNILIASAGVDESNANGFYVLWPSNAFASARSIRKRLMEKHSLERLAVVITDSHCTPLRRGVNGITIGYSGLNPLKNYMGKPDLFGRPLAMTQANVVDALTSMAVLLMGESNESTPLCIGRGLDGIVEYAEGENKDFVIPLEEDLFEPILKDLTPKN
ncbi:hypothetical protein AUJ14_01305 [Candidatus Micrarchaeota archaeon CG1_02_55_22]|nr:MAG: hypothetical protein AUJ14_01305 [Candidatus Micrarchaeota archaeon CG1_02_55_22]